MKDGFVAFHRKKEEVNRHGIMKKTLLGKTQMEVSVIGFGGIPIQRLPLRKAMDLVEEAVSKGIIFFDTAQAYGDSEAKIGKGIKKRREECIVATKSFCRTALEAVSDVGKALLTLKTDYIDLYQIHYVNKSGELEKILSAGGALEGLIPLRKDGIIRHIGITGHRPDPLRHAIEECQELETVQFPFNIIEDGKGPRLLLEAAKKLDIGTIIMKPLAGGMITDAELSLRWILAQGVDTVIPGMSLSSEIRANSTVGDRLFPLSVQELCKLKAEVEALEKDFCRRCMYCEPCPHGVPIYLVQEWGDKVKLAVVKDMYRDMYARLDKTVKDCTECGDCEEKCPYGLPIREILKEKHRLLTES